MAAGGYVGVDVFFVISGFLITSVMRREMVSTGTISVRGFYARRALRLLPASSLVGVATLIGAWFFLSKIRFTEYAGDAIASFLYAVNFRLAAAGTDYLAQTAPPSPFQHFWSLAVEEQFYLVWPLVLLLSWKALSSRRLVWLPLAVLSGCSLALSVVVTGTSAPWAYFGPHTRMWELGIGALVALGAARLKDLPSAVASAMTWAGLCAIGLAVVSFDENTAFPGYHALLPVLGTALVIAGGCAPARYDARLLLARRPMTWLGGISYGWYLWHWPILNIVPKAIGRPATTSLHLALSAVALVVAWMTLRTIENPVRFHSFFRGRPLRGLALGLALSLVSTCIALAAAARPPAIDSGTPAVDLANALAKSPQPEHRLVELLASADTRLPSNLTPGLQDVPSVRSKIYQQNCHVGAAETRAVSCEFGDPTSKTVVVLFGDSHAAQWFPALDRIAVKHRWKLVTITKASCKIADVTITKDGKPYTACDRWRENALAKIQKLRPAMVIASSSDAGSPARPMANPLDDWTSGFRRTLDSLTASTTRVSVILDTPWPRGDAVDCASSYPLQLGRCAGRLPEAIQDPMKSKAIAAAARGTRVDVVDPVRWFCSESGACPLVVGNVIVYRDESHIADAYAEALVPVLEGRLRLNKKPRTKH
ncbi:acyltransferase [Planotetraspora thailandica]|uniref:Acyltransferase n=1 Tax=Planotetraspora thailandica TaxID=487172 RepID=A0A8J3VEQ3_9ACTN|nr:acyltransferase [Planotetraspora thailandica]